MKSFSFNQLERYPIYLKLFKELEAEGVNMVSSPRIAEKLGYSEEQVRKDLQNVSLEPGRPKKGREVHRLIEDLETFLGYREKIAAAVIGVGHLGGALMNFPAFSDMGLEIVAGFDSNEKLIGTSVGGKQVYGLSSIAEVFEKLHVRIAILTVPASSAQQSAELAISSGAKGIWNFAPVLLSLPENIAVENTNLASSLAVLCHQLNHQEDDN